MSTANTHEMTAHMYLKIFVVLIGLTLLTFIQPYIMAGSIANTVMAQLFFASIKAVLIGSYYMHLKYESSLFRYIVLFALVILAIFFIITATDAIFRNEAFDMFK